LSDIEFSEKAFKRSYSEKKRENRLFLNIWNKYDVVFLWL
jgi:hypothetical protein